MKFFTTLLVFFFLLAVWANETPAVEVTGKFPDSPFNMFVNGETINLLLTFKNKAEETLKVVGVNGRFTLPSQYDKVVRNLTRMVYNVDVPAGQEITVQFRFKTDFEPGVMGFTSELDFLNEKGQGFKTHAHDADLNIADPPFSLFDPQILFLIAFGICSLILTGYLIKQAFFPTMERRKSGDVKPRDVKKVQKEGVDLDWIPKEHLKKTKKRK